MVKINEKYITEIKAGTYRISIRTGKSIDGKNLYYTKQISNVTLNETKKVRDQMIRECVSKNDMDGNVKVKDFAKDYLEFHVSRLEATTYDEKESKLRIHILPYIGEYKMKDIKPMLIQRLVSYLEKQNSLRHDRLGNVVKLSPTTIKNIYTVISGMFTKAVELSVIKENPCRNITLPKVVQFNPSIYNLEEMNNLLKLIDESSLSIQNKCIFILAMS